MFSHELLEKAKNGDMLAQYQLACAYKDGKGTEKNEKEAFKWYMESAKQGYPDAQAYVGYFYRWG
ncbi:MAG: sel1 repeat family protein, partial [Clostridia bacterium]|nr:sel1 repeat family protein [Clostridia bacterium]